MSYRLAFVEVMEGEEIPQDLPNNGAFYYEPIKDLADLDAVRCGLRYWYVDGEGE